MTWALRLFSVLAIWGAINLLAVAVAFRWRAVKRRRDDRAKRRSVGAHPFDLRRAS